MNNVCLLNATLVKQSVSAGSSGTSSGSNSGNNDNGVSDSANSNGAGGSGFSSLLSLVGPILGSSSGSGVSTRITIILTRVIGQ